MNFCKNCDNMYYLKINSDDGDDKLVHYCRNCGDENNNLNENICVYEADLQNNNTNINLINEYTKYDPTLPRTTTIRCQIKNVIAIKMMMIAIGKYYIFAIMILIWTMFICVQCVIQLGRINR